MVCPESRRSRRYRTSRPSQERAVVGAGATGHRNDCCATTLCRIEQSSDTIFQLNINRIVIFCNCDNLTAHSLATVVNLLRRTPSDGFHLARLGDTLTNLVVACPLPHLVREILDNRQLLQTIAARSIYHPNGYMRLLLADERPQFALQLHIWDGRSDSSYAMPHDHPWNFATRILCGVYCSTTYQVTAAGGLFDKYLIQYSQQTRSYHREHVARVTLATTSRNHWAAHTMYTMAPSCIHQIDTPDVFSATLLLRGPNLRRFSHAYSDIAKHTIETVAVLPAAPSQLRKPLTRLIALCA